jgi:alginate O-acetyltransferase complex protein AlgI
VVDVYRGVHKPLDRFWDYQLYIIFFPKLIAGPIVRYHDIADQISDRSAYEDSEHRLRGFYRFILGLSKKVLIANIVGEGADIIIKSNPADISTAYAWLGILFYTMQIYFDFSGYSDMALGLALMMGFRLPENFNNPYTAVSITDFWRRWHISLGTWMRNYLYIPLGGNRVNSKLRLYFNLWLVFLASGLWHGAAWGFVIWGAYHGLFLVIERSFLSRWLDRIGRFAVLYTFPVVVVGWVFFRFEHWTPAIAYLHRMFVPYFGDMYNNSGITREHYVVLSISLFFAFVTLVPLGRRWCSVVYEQSYTNGRHLIMFLISVILFVLSAGYILISGFNPFIYFRF